MQLRKKLMWLAVAMAFTVLLGAKWYINSISRLDTNILVSSQILITEIKGNEPYVTRSKEGSKLNSTDSDRVPIKKRSANTPTRVFPKKVHNSVATHINKVTDVKRKVNQGRPSKKRITDKDKDHRNRNRKRSTTTHGNISTKNTTRAITKVTKTKFGHRLNKLGRVLSRAACENKIILTIVDRAYLPMFWNLWRSIENVKLTHCFLPISLDLFSFEALTNKNITSYFQVEDHPNMSHSGIKISQFGTVEFNRKTNLKIKYLLEVLNLGYNVLFTDGDVVFLRNPFQTLNCDYPNCDLAVQSNAMNLPWQLLKESGLYRNTKTEEINSGFMYCRSTKPTKSLFKRVRTLSLKGNFSKNDQDYLNIAAQPILCNTTKSDLKIKILDKQKYVPGLVFKQMKTVGPEVVIIHNNFLMKISDKIARFKKYGLWYHST